MTLIKAGVIQKIAQSDSPLSADDLAKVSGADRLLIGMKEVVLGTRLDWLTSRKCAF